jgi:hypothetical protein
VNSLQEKQIDLENMSAEDKQEAQKIVFNTTK